MMVIFLSFNVLRNDLESVTKCIHKFSETQSMTVENILDHIGFILENVQTTYFTQLYRMVKSLPSLLTMREYKLQ